MIGGSAHSTNVSVDGRRERGGRIVRSSWHAHSRHPLTRHHMYLYGYYDEMVKKNSRRMSEARHQYALGFYKYNINIRHL